MRKFLLVLSAVSVIVLLVFLLRSGGDRVRVASVASPHETPSIAMSHDSVTVGPTKIVRPIVHATDGFGLASDETKLSETELNDGSRRRLDEAMRAAEAAKRQLEAVQKQKSAPDAREKQSSELPSSPRPASALPVEPQVSEAQKTRPSVAILQTQTVRPLAAAPTPIAAPEEIKDLELIAERNCREKMRKLGVVSAGTCIDISSIVDDLAVGTYAFNKPTTAFVGESFKLVLALKTSDKQDIKESFFGLTGAVTERQGKFAQSLEASLRGDDLTIEPAGSQLRTATLNEAVEWDWTITPKSGGQKTMIIDVAANIEVGPNKHKVKVKTLREAIIIQVSVLQQIKMYVAEANGYVFAASATVTAIAGMIGFVPSIRSFIVNFLWRRRKPQRYGR